MSKKFEYPFHVTIKSTDDLDGIMMSVEGHGGDMFNGICNALMPSGDRPSTKMLDMFEHACKSVRSKMKDDESCDESDMFDTISKKIDSRPDLQKLMKTLQRELMED